jgi:hypothetical protein
MAKVSKLGSSEENIWQVTREEKRKQTNIEENRNILTRGQQISEFHSSYILAPEHPIFQTFMSRVQPIWPYRY